MPRRRVLRGDGETTIELIPSTGAGRHRPPMSAAALRAAAGHAVVGSVMTTDVVCVRADVSLEALAALFLDRDIGGVPVVGADGYPLGVVSKTDLVRERRDNGDDTGAEERPDGRRFGDGYHVERFPRGTVADIMTPMAFTLREDAPLTQAAAMMAVEGVHRVLVVSDAGSVVGIVSSLDVLRWLAWYDGQLD
jgi:CBS domain-containing protein